MKSPIRPALTALCLLMVATDSGHGQGNQVQPADCYRATLAVLANCKQIFYDSLFTITDANTKDGRRKRLCRNLQLQLDCLSNNRDRITLGCSTIQLDQEIGQVRNLKFDTCGSTLATTSVSLVVTTWLLRWILQ